MSHAPVPGVQIAVEASAFAWTREGPSELRPPIITIRPSARGVAVCHPRLGACGTERSISQRCVLGFQTEPLPLPNMRIRPSARMWAVAPAVEIPGAGPATLTAWQNATSGRVQTSTAARIAAASRAPARNTGWKVVGTEVLSVGPTGKLWLLCREKARTRSRLMKAGRERSSLASIHRPVT